MLPADLSSFLNALDAVKQDYVCAVCFEMCKDPVTLSKCFHMICGEHFESLKSCPKCNISLADSTVFTDDRLASCIDSAKELDKIMEPYRSKEPSGSGKRPKKDEKSKLTVKTTPSKSNKTASDLGTIKKAFSDRTNVTKQNVSENANTTILSNFSSGKLNKAAEKRNNTGETKLHIACRLGKVDSVMELLNQGANPNTKDNAGWTPLHEVVQNGRLDLVRVLLQYNTLIDVPGLGNETPLHEAIRYKHWEIAEELVKNGADMHARNCKGETPYQLASPDMKKTLLAAADNLIQTQTVNINHIAFIHIGLDSDDIHVYCVSRFRTIHSKLKTLTKHHNNIHIEAKFTKKVTHLVVDTEEDLICTSSIEVLQGIVNAIWVVSTQWITKCTEEKMAPFETYEVVGVGTNKYKGPKNSRYNKYKQKPGIFDGCHFYLHNFNMKYEISKTIVLTKAIISKLVTDAGGIILRRVPNPELIPENEQLVPYHAQKDSKLRNCSHYIIFKDIYEPMYNMQHLKALPIGWLLECIEKYELCEPMEVLIK